LRQRTIDFSPDQSRQAGIFLHIIEHHSSSHWYLARQQIGIDVSKERTSAPPVNTKLTRVVSIALREHRA